MKARSHVPGTGLSPGIRAGIFVAIGVATYLVFEFGRLLADYNIADAIRTEHAYQSQIRELEDEIVALKQEVAVHETHRDIDREAYEVVESRFAELEQKIQEQADAIAFYRGIVSPKDGGRGLRVQDLKLVRGSNERNYHVRLVLVQVMQHDRSVKGEVEFSLDGQQDGVAASYKLADLLPDDGSSNWPFAFRYFQDFDREFVLPEGFTPEKINVEVVSRTKSIASISQSFDWLAAQS